MDKEVKKELIRKLNIWDEIRNEKLSFSVSGNRFTFYMLGLGVGIGVLLIMIFTYYMGATLNSCTCEQVNMAMYLKNNYNRECDLFTERCYQQYTLDLGEFRSEAIRGAEDVK